MTRKLIRKGGDPSLAMTFAVKYGLTDAERYPYQNTKKQSCQPAAKSPVASFSSYKVLPSYDEEALETFIEKTPLTVNICASYRTFMYYSSGIYDDSNCCDNGVDHAVLLVGYGTDKKNQTKTIGSFRIGENFKHFLLTSLIYISLPTIQK